jgi:hypothetical protein
MKIKLTTTAYTYHPDRIADLVKLGFTFQSVLHDTCRLARIPEFVEINLDSLEDLMAFAAKHGKIIVSEEGIEIYDGYRE